MLYQITRVKKEAITYQFTEEEMREALKEMKRECSEIGILNIDEDLLTEILNVYDVIGDLDNFAIEKDILSDTFIFHEINNNNNFSKEIKFEEASYDLLKKDENEVVRRICRNAGTLPEKDDNK